MKNIRSTSQQFFLLSIAMVLLLSCRSVPTKPYSYGGYRTSSRLLGKGRFSSGKMYNYLLHYHKKADWRRIKKLAQLYIYEAKTEGINHDIAFAQMCHETNLLRYGGQVKARQYNYCGLGAIDNGASGAVFPNMQTGVRAHIQHLKAYASTKSLRRRIVDPRFHLVRRGSAPTIKALTGKWASDREYHQRILRHLGAISRN